MNHNSGESVSEKKKTNAKVIIPAIIAIVIAIAVIVVAVMISNRNRNASDVTHTATSDQIKASGFLDTPTFDIDLGFATLKFPQTMQDTVTIEGAGKHDAADKFTVKFLLDKTPCFDLNINGDEGDYLGTLKGDNNTVFRAVFYDAGKEPKVSEIQEAVNIILYHLERDYDFTRSDMVAGETDNKEVFKIKTNVVDLYYPKRWEDRVTVKVTDTKVSFSDGDTPLFDICFEKVEGYHVGDYNNTPVYLVDYKTKTDEQAVMQEDINVTLQHLSEDPAFVAAD